MAPRPLFRILKSVSGIYPQTLRISKYEPRARDFNNIINKISAGHAAIADLAFTSPPRGFAMLVQRQVSS